MQCFKCGEEQSEGNIFCTKCGTRLMGVQAPPQGRTEATPATVSSSAHEEEQKILKELKDALKGVEGEKDAPPEPSPVFGDSSKKVWFVGLILLLLVIVGVNVLMMRNRETPSQEVPPAPNPPAVETPGAAAPSSAPSVDEATRLTKGKMAGILEGISNYSSRKKGLPPTLVAVGRSYADPGILQDGWGQNILYLVDLTNKTFVLTSAGADGKKGTADDLIVPSEEAANWLKENESVIGEWKEINPNLYAQLANNSPTPAQVQQPKATDKQELEKKRAADAKAQARIQADADQERKRLAAARQEEEKKQAEAKKREEELRLAKAKEDALREQIAAKKPESVKDDFSKDLTQWDAPPTWEISQEKDGSSLKIQGLGFLKKGNQWDNYKVEFDVRINKESAGWVIRAQNQGSFYLFKLSSDKAKAVPKNSLLRYIRSDDKYLNSLKQEDAPGAAGVTSLPFKVKNKDFYRITITVRGNTITHAIDGTEVDVWTDNTFNHGRFGFNASVIELATIRNFQVEPLN
ncbi:MAG: hypothetical protein U0V70_21665 [Terriglobia bacterium]